MTAVAVVWAVASLIGDVPLSLAVTLFFAAVGAAAMAGGAGPTLTAGAGALLGWWLLGLPFDLLVLGAFTLGALLLGAAGESVRRSRQRAGVLAAELAVTQRRLADEAAGRRRAERAEAAMSRVQERFQRLVDSNVVPVVVTDGEGRCLDANSAFQDLVGWRREDLAGDRARWDSLTLPAERLLDERAAAEAQAHGAAAPYERTLVLADGRRVPVLVGALAVAPGESALLWFLIDLGARQRLAEERAERALLDVIFEGAPVGLGVYDRELRFVRLNRRLAEINGLPPEQQLGHRLPDVLPQLGPEVFEAFAEVFRTGEPIERAQAHGRTPASPEERYWEVSYYPVRTGDGPLLGVAAVVFEVTDRRRAEAERERLLWDAERARADAESASRTKDEFLAVLSHELRAPLQGVLGWVSLLRNGRLDASQQARALQAIERSTRLQTQLINDLLDVSRIISGKLTVESRPLDLSAAVREAIDQLRPAAAARGITLDAEITECGMTLADPARLHQVLGNLLSNAIKFTPAGGTITVRCGQDGDDTVIAIHDTGEGIAREFLPHVFERFRQADSSSSRRHGGLGLGLAITRRLVELHGGRIAAESPGPDQGATFTVWLPRREPGRRSAAPAAAGPAGGTLAGRRVLVVEDDADSREAIALALALEGAQVDVAGSADEAVRRASGASPDVVVSDLSMPGADGYVLLETLRARGIDAPAVALTGFATLEDRHRALAAGFRAHIPKPVDVDRLVRTIEGVVAA